MNTPIKQFALSTFIALAFIGSANAQRGERHDGGGSRSFDRGGSNERRSGGFSSGSSVSRQNNASFDRQSRRESFDNRVSSVTPGRQSRNFDNRDVVRSSTDWRMDQSRVNNGFSQQRVSRNTPVYNNARVVNNYRYSSAYSYAPRRWAYYGAPRYSVLPYGALTIRFGGYPYYYHSGLFFGYYNGFYEPVFAPIGIHVNILPIGYHPFYIGPTRYYYYDGIYYRNYNDNEYEVIDAPLGAQVSVLPKGATVATINGEKFYEFNGTYYKEGTNSKNEVVYTVVGKYGHVNNSEAGVSDLQQPALHVGDVIPVLPDGCKEVTINGEQLYLSPDNTYFKAQTSDGNTSYKIVGMGEKQ
ncbi:DUF6515 family protein [Flavisolibacter ginsenosidimutans]|uniref:Uncharacterized protein n=1 Tax=Flavisolibacter ginsenosidimutans TaxID=661481 RepID=A0A5B8ULS6_9BACT|nr:DUF6515 family protein [Flavisolibacter ginsenosidimutans]QEC57396.1 hypothetical protein FSB75_16305 [Flavisolibacter ginsenosidimutans]